VAAAAEAAPDACFLPGDDDWFSDAGARRLDMLNAVRAACEELPIVIQERALPPAAKNAAARESRAAWSGFPLALLLLLLLAVVEVAVAVGVDVAAAEDAEPCATADELLLLLLLLLLWLLLLLLILLEFGSAAFASVP
jgi:hypothetical protein